MKTNTNTKNKCRYGMTEHQCAQKSENLCGQACYLTNQKR